MPFEEPQDEIQEERDMLAESMRLQRVIEEASQQRDELQQRNNKLQRKIAVLLQKNQENGEQRKEDKSSASENEKRYLECLRSVHEARVQATNAQTQYDRIALELQAKLDEKESKVNEIQDSFIEFKREIAKSAESMRTGKPIPKRVISQFEAADMKKDQEVEKVRLKNINLRTHLKKLEQQLHAKEQLAEGLHLIDFEQLKIENQTLNEKIEERNEELHKLRKKTTSTVQVLTHIKEKLQFVLAENQTLKHELADLEDSLSLNREKLAKKKKERDANRQISQRLKNKEGFAKSELLIEDFDRRQAEMVELERRLAELLQRHTYLTKLVTRKPQSG